MPVADSTDRTRLHRVVLALLLCSTHGCVRTRVLPAHEREQSPVAGAPAQLSRGFASAWSVMTWNLRWFQDPVEAPRDDERQYRAVRDILGELEPTIVALQEVASEAAFLRLRRDLGNLSGVLSGYSWIQKTALLWRAEHFELVYARAIAGLQDTGRPPLEVLLRAKQGGSELLFVVIHAKADATRDSYAQRVAFAAGLKRHLDQEHGAQHRIVLGDFNDRLAGSLLPDMPSPYQSFIEDPAYLAPTSELARADGGGVDHILLSASLGLALVPGSGHVLRNELLEDDPEFLAAVSDHFPVQLRLEPLASAHARHFALPEAAHEVVVDDARRLQERVYNRGPDETEAAPLEIFRQRIRKRVASGHVLDALRLLLHGTARNRLPDVRVERAVFALHL